MYNSDHISISYCARPNDMIQKDNTQVVLILFNSKLEMSYPKIIEGLDIS